ncbi:MAG: squalene synthase HpnC [Caulobacterales bacterium]
MSAAELASGKGHTDENFPVASHLIAARHRPAILAFYRVARLADDVADHPTATTDEKLARLAEIEASLLGKSAGSPEAVALRQVLSERSLDGAHALDLLEAFRRDVTKTRYDDWAELMDYCRYSAAPVGRFVLDVHGEDRSTWPASDALCAALQVINHLQDCAKDYLELDRVYLPLDVLEAAGAQVEMLGSDQAAPALLAAIRSLASRTQGLLDQARPLAGQVRDLRLALEIGAIHRLARSLVVRLMRRDPLAERVHHSRLEALGVAALGVGAALGSRPGARQRRQAGP